MAGHAFGFGLSHCYIKVLLVHIAKRHDLSGGLGEVVTAVIGGNQAIADDADDADIDTAVRRDIS